VPDIWSLDTHQIKKPTPRPRVASVWPFLPAPSYPASLPHMSELPAVLPGKRAGYPPACLGKSSMKHRRGGGSACIRPAANAAELMRAHRRTNLFGGCPVAAHPVRGVPSAGRKRRQPTKLLEQLPHHLRPKSTGRPLYLVLQSLFPGIRTTAPGRVRSLQAQIASPLARARQASPPSSDECPLSAGPPGRLRRRSLTAMRPDLPLGLGPSGGGCTRITDAGRGSNDPGEFPESGRRTGLV
jgi:hypothetical protein